MKTKRTWTRERRARFMASVKARQAKTVIRGHGNTDHVDFAVGLLDRVINRAAELLIERINN